MDTNYERAVNNLEKLLRVYEEDLPEENLAILEWSILFLKEHPDYLKRTMRQ